ncbi:abscisic acid receptor PYL4-like [Canna indica]|uniref:Abscisic acid receptor PYL4-like n=1 Tax=Canna indica TaxID=4628 RepID=A0AAQ3JP19_9LILI|nr:abscisic acid receptor PYL4-like [Canna indica]
MLSPLSRKLSPISKIVENKSIICFFEQRSHKVPEAVARHHDHIIEPHQYCSFLTQAVLAPAMAVSSVVQLFDEPHVYKHFIKSCSVLVLIDDGDMGTLREVHVISGMPTGRHQHRAPRDPRRRERWA